MTNALDVHLYDRIIGQILLKNNKPILQYSPAYVDDPQAVPLSVQFPVRSREYANDDVESYLENLLPDSAAVREQWARDAGLLRANTFDLLTVYGGDVAGGIELYPEGKGRSDNSSLTPVNDSWIADRIRTIRADPTAWNNSTDRVGQFSLAGAQGKFALALHDEGWYEPSGAHPSTHIFKPGIANLDGSDISEHVLMQTAQRLGLEAATTQLLEFDQEHVLVVERFDRYLLDGKVKRVHQEDFAQATATPVLHKYEQDGGPGVAALAQTIARHCSDDQIEADLTALTNALVFFWIIGHGDAHAKNYSLLLLPGLTKLAPFYDINCNFLLQTTQVIRAQDYNGFNGTELAMKVNGVNTVGAYTHETLAELSKTFGLHKSYASEVANFFAQHIQSALNQVISELPKNIQKLRSHRKSASGDLLPNTTSQRRVSEINSCHVSEGFCVGFLVTQAIAPQKTTALIYRAIK
ncbi:HipA domain-containing protein [Timonella sp. A28]|uniref:HipA domain-containing protein n=1 Tax=Timonella sp. A28 TaxID=3442640 RepID=UPI003EBFAB86